MTIRAILAIATTCLIASCAGHGDAALPADPVQGAFALIAPAAADALRDAPTSPARAAAIRSADRVADRLPHTVPRIHVEGTLPHQGIYDESREALRDFPAARDLALAARLTGRERYATQAARLIEAWSSAYRPSFNPIDETGIDGLVVAYDLLPDAAKAPLARSVGRLLRELAEGYLERMPSLRGGTATNNWQSHRIKLVALTAYAIGDPALIAGARRAYAAQLAANIGADGTTIDFTQRDAVHYVVYDLEPLALAALAAARHGDDWYHLRAPSGASLAQALDWLVPYADGSRTHVEFVHSTVRFDGERRDAGVPGFAGDFDPKVAREVFALAARLDGRYAALARKLGASDPLLDIAWPLASK